MAVLIYRAYKFELKTNASQRQHLDMFAGCCRFVWNKVLALQVDLLNQQSAFLSYIDCASELVKWKNTECSFLKNVNAQILQQTLMNLDKALKSVSTNGTGFPKFKKKGQRSSFRCPQDIKIDADRIYFPKLGWFKFHKSRDIDGKIKNVTVSTSGGKWYVSIQVELEIADPIHPSDTAVGIDLGVVRLATMSDGVVIEQVSSFRKHEATLVRAQRKLSRKVKYSNNWRKQKAKIQKLHSKIANTRKDFLHKATTSISKNHAIIVLEDLKVKNMSKSAKGTVDKPGTNVAVKSGLNKAILDQGWYEFRRQLQYKQLWSGGKVIGINPANTSRRCADCGYVSKENRQTQAHFKCVSCGHAENADLNAAKNILAAGQAVLACGDIKQAIA